MSNLILDASDSPIKQPRDPFWDAPASRREMMKLVNDLALNDNVLSNRADTGHIILNLICEKLSITRGEIEAYVEKKKGEVLSLVAEEKAKQEAQSGQ